MNAFKQLGLLLKQNLLERRRRPIISLLEALWPLAVVVVFVIVRKEISGPLVPDCNHKPRALPSAGTMVFIQSLLCSLGGRYCVDKSETLAKRSLAEEAAAFNDSQSKLTALLTRFQHLVTQNFEVVQALPSLISESLSLLSRFGLIVGNSKNIQEFLAIDLRVRTFLKDGDAIIEMCDAIGLSSDFAKVLLNSTVDLSNLGSLLVNDGDTRTILCQIGRNLLIPPDSTSSLLVRTMCSMNATQSASFEVLLQTQLSVDAIMKMAADVAKAFGEPVVSKSVQYIYSVIKVLSDTRTTTLLASWQHQLSDLKDVAFIAYQFVTNPDNGAKLALLSTAGAMDAVITSLDKFLVNNSAWTEFSSLWALGKRLYKSVTNTITPDNSTLPFTVAFSDPTELTRLVQQAHNVSADFTKSLQVSEVTVYKVVNHLSLLLGANASLDSCTLTASFWDVFVFPPAIREQMKASINSITDIACSTSKAHLYVATGTIFNLDGLLKKIDSVSRAGISDGIMQQIFKISNAVLNFYAQNEPLLQALRALDYGKLWQTIRQLAAGDYAGKSSDIEQIYAVLEAVQGYLRSSPHWNIIQQQLGLTDLYLDISLSLLNGSQDIIHFLQGKFISEHATENQLNLTEVLSQLVAKDIEKITNWEVLQSIYRTTATAYGWQDKLCEILNTSFSTGLSNVSTEALKSTICERSFRVFQQRIRSSYDVQPLRSRIVDLVTAFKGLSRKVTSRPANLTEIIIKVYQAVELLLQFQNKSEWFFHSTGLPPATVLLHYAEVVVPDLIASYILGDVSNLAEQISQPVLTKFAKSQLDGEPESYESAQNLSMDLTRVLEQLTSTNETSLLWLMTIAGRTTPNFTLGWLSEQISKNFIEIINNLPSSSDCGTIISDSKSRLSEASISEYLRHGAALIVATERTLINLISWVFQRNAGLPERDAAAQVAASVCQFLSGPRSSSDFSSSAVLIIDALQTTVADLNNATANKGQNLAMNILLQYLRMQQASVESVLQLLLSASWSYSSSQNATSVVPFYASHNEGCSVIVNELIATLTHDLIPEVNPVSLLIVNGAFDIAALTGLNYSAHFLDRFVQTFIDLADRILWQTSQPSIHSPAKPTNISCMSIRQAKLRKSFDINDAASCSDLDCESLVLLSSSVSQLSATIFSIINATSSRRWTNGCHSPEECSAFATTLLDSLFRYAEDTHLLQAFHKNWLAVADHVMDFAVVISRSLTEAVSLVSSFTQFWVLLPEDLQINALTLELEKLLLPISSDYTQASTALCRMTDTLNYTAIEGHRIALQHYFCNGNISAFVTQISSYLDVPTIADKAKELQAIQKKTEVSLNFSAAQFYKKIMNISNYVPLINKNITAYLTTLHKVSESTNQATWQRLLVKFANRLYQLASTSFQQSFASATNNYFSTSNVDVANANRMRRSASVVANNNDTRNLTSIDYDRDSLPTNSSAHLQSLEEMCSKVLAAALQVGLPTQMLPSSTAKLHSALDRIANALSSLASLIEMTGDILRADFVELMKATKSLDISKITELFFDQESNEGKPGDFCRSLADPAQRAMEAFEQIVDAIQDYSKLNETRLKLSLNSSLVYLESVFEAALGADSLIRATRVAAGSGDIQQLISPMLKAVLDYAILPSSYAKLSSLFVHKNFTEALNSDVLAENLTEIMDSAINVDAMILVLSSNPATVDKTICASAEAMRSLFAAVDENETIFTDAFCSKIGSLTPSSLVRSLNVSLIRQLQSRMPLSLVLANMVDVGTSFLNILADTGLARLPKQNDVLSQLIYLLQQVAVPSINAKLSNLSQLAISFEGDFDRVIPYIDDINLKNLSSLIDKVIQGLKSFVELQEQLKVSVRLKDIFPRNISVLATLVSSRKRSIELMESVLDQPVNLNPLISLASPTAIQEYVCSQDGLVNELHSNSWKSTVTAEDIRRAVCEQDPSMAAEIALSIKQALSPQSLSNKVLQAIPERMLGSDGGSLLNDSRSLLPLYQFFSQASSTMTDFQGTINVPASAIGIAEQTSGEAFVLPEHITALSSVFCGSPVDLNSLQSAASFATRRKRSVEEEYAEFIALPSEVCQALMLTIRQQKYGRIIWAFIKPFLSGKILYTPSNNFTDFVILKANRTFVEASQIVEFFRSLRKGLLDSALSDQAVQMLTRKTLDLPALKHPLVQKVLNKAISFDQDSIRQLLQLVNKDANSTTTLLQLSSIIIQASACISFNRFEKLQSEDDLVTRAKVLSRNNSFLAGVVFLDSAESGKQDVRYKIRMNRDNVPSTSSIREQVYMPAPLDDFLGNLKYLQGFVQLQDMIEQAIMDVLLNVTGAAVRPVAEIRQMPAPCYYDDPFRGLMYPYLLLIIVASGYLFSVAHSIKTLVYYRQEGLDEVLKLVGVRSCTIWIAWFMNNYLFMLFISGIVTVMIVYLNIVPLTDPLIIFLYLALFSFTVLSFSFLISAFFTKANMAATLGVMVYFLFFLPYATSITWSHVITQKQQMAISLFSPSAFAYGTEQITRWEQLGVGAHWSNMAKSLSFNERSLSLAWAFIWMLIDGVIYFIIGWYFVSVLPTKYGAPRPWYFPLTPSFWKPEICAARTRASKSYTLPALAEEEFYNYVVGISVQGLSKAYKTKQAVTDLSVDFYEGQVTAFLGKNGAGKTTTIHMLTGIRQPTSGSAYINGMDISQDMAKIRLTLGFCPQFDILFDYMTVKEHLDYFAELKGDGQKLTAKRLLDDMGLAHVADELVGNISGGLRRRLSVALAFCGESKTIILDEPTSSVDPNGRRAIWDVILKYRPNKTIVLCTHHLDEAELISDRVAIVKEGKLLCTGSPMALKRQHSEGHKLLIELKEPLPLLPNDGSTYSTSPVVEFVKSSMPSAELVVTSSNTKLAFRLPLENRQQYGHLCQALDEQLENFGIQNYAITDCTLEQVFLAVTRENPDQLQNDSPNGRTGCLSCLPSRRASPMPEAVSSSVLASDEAPETQSSEITVAQSSVHGRSAPLPLDASSCEPTLSNGCTSTVATTLGVRRFVMRLLALFTKRLYHNIRNWKSYVSLLVLPCVFVGLAAMVSTITPDENNRPDLVLQPALYPESYLFFSDTSAGQQLSEALLKNYWSDLPCLQNRQNSSSCKLADSAKKSVCPAVPDALPVCSCAGTPGRTQQGQCDSRPPRVDEWPMNDNSALHRVCDAYSLDKYLYATSLLDQYKGRRIGGWTARDVDSVNGSSAITTTWFDNRAYHSMPVLLNAINNAVLRSSGSRTLRNASITVSSHPITFTSASLDLATILRSVADAGLALFVLVAVSFLPAGLLPFTVNERLGGERRQQELCGLGTGTYWLVAVLWDLLAFALSVSLMLGMVAAFGIRSYVARDNAGGFAILLLLYGWAALPFSYTFARVFKSSVTAFFGTLLFSIFVGTLLTTTFLMLRFVPAEFLSPGTLSIAANACLAMPQYALTSGLVQMTVNQLQADILEPFGILSYANPLVLLKWNFTALAVEGLVFLIVALVIESWHSPCQLPTWLWPCSRKRSCKAVNSGCNTATTDDDDVIAERERALHCDVASQAVVLRDVRRQFWGLNRTLVVVDSLSFAVSHGECFGMLGVNGAGKTTTFRMMTGALVASNGEIYILGKRITSASSSRPVIGYCPQENALDGKLTGREMLQFYGRLRGIAPEVLDKEIYRLTDAFRMAKFVERRTGTYSGGMKRTLSVALAMLGRPNLVFLDEPTAGMDPHARQVVWQQVRAYVAAGGSVILTSHSMNECDQLCDRLAIMVNGRFACIGSPQHLKNRYADGHTVLLKVKGTRVPSSAVTTFIEEQLSGTNLVDGHGGVLEFFVPFSSAKLGDLYLFVERYRQKLDIVDYTIAQTTLDQVFIRFARLQSSQSTSCEATSEDSVEA